MTSTASDPQVQITLRARASALAWLNAFSASGDDEGRPALNRTLSLEFFRHGLQLVGCDGTVLCRTWVPEIPHDKEKLADWPWDGEAPQKSVVVRDPDGFGLGYMRTLLKVTGEEEHEFDELVITTAEQDEDATLALGDEFMRERLILRACGQRTDLQLYEAPFPDWRALRFGIEEVERVESMTLAPRVLALVGKLRGAFAVDLEFHGETRHVGFIARGEGEVRGLLMPMRKRVEPKS